MTDNIANTRRGFAAFAEGDLDTLRELLDPEIVWHVPGRNSLAGDYRGIDATMGFFMQVFERSGGTFKSELLECGEIAPDLVACLVNIKGTAAGGSIDQRSMMLFQQRAGRSIEVWNFSIDQHAQDKAWGPATVALPDARKEAVPVTN
jgi:uncharacterized protein